MDIEYRISIRFDNYSVVSFLLFHCIDFMNENDYFFGGCQDSIFGFTVVYGAYWSVEIQQQWYKKSLIRVVDVLQTPFITWCTG